MADSMLDFGGAARNMLAMGNLLEAQERNDLTAQHQDLERQRLQQQEKQFKETAFQQELKNTYELSKDERLQFIPEVRNKLLLKVAVMAGAPDIGINAMTQNMEMRDRYLKGLASQNPDEVSTSLQGLMTGMPAEKVENLIKSTEQMGVLHQNLLKTKVWIDMNQPKVEALQRDNAKVQISKPLYTAVSATFRDELRGTESPQFKRLQAIRNAAPDKDWLSKEAATQLGSTVFPHLIGGKSSQKAEQMKMAADKYAEQVNADQKLLEDADHGIALPKNVSKHELQARIEAHSTLLGAVRDMQSWYENPLDKDKLAAAKAAYTTIESRRLDIEKLEKNTSARTSQYQQDALSFRQSESEIKHGEKSALAQAQVQYYELPVSQQTPQAAAKIAKSIQESTGMPVQVDDIIKNPNKPLVENKIINAGEQEYTKKFADKMADADSKMLDAAQQAPEIHDRASRVIDLLNNKKVITGLGADFRLELAKGLKMAGLSSSDTAENTEVLFTELADSTLAAIKASGLGAGNGFTNTDREYLEKAKGGRISLEKDSLMRIAKISQRVAELTADKWNTRVKRIPDSALASTGITREPINPRKNQPSAPASKAAPQPGVIPSRERIESYGKRMDGTPKGAGYFGEIPSPITPGEFSTELTIDVNIGGKEVGIPLITPNLSRSEIEAVMRAREGKDIPRDIVNKATEHAKSRMKHGKSPYADDGEVRSLPEWKPKEFDRFYNSLSKGESYIGPDGKKRTKR